MTITTTELNTEAGKGSASIGIAAPPDAVFAVVSDLTRMGGFSPECVGVDLGDDFTLVRGATFVGRNARDGDEWTTDCRVLEVVPGRRFSFVAGDEDTGTTWSFDVVAAGGGSVVTETFDSRRLRHPEWAQALAGRAEQLVADMQATLRSIRDAVEGSN